VDDADNADVLLELLSADGHYVDRAANGVAALNKVAEHPYDVILSNIKMPKLDGPGFYREVERRHLELAPRVVFITGDSLSQKTREFLERSGVHRLDKPFSPKRSTAHPARVTRCGGTARMSLPDDDVTGRVQLVDGEVTTLSRL